LRGARFLAYALDRSRSLRAARLASGHLRDVFQRPAKAAPCRRLGFFHPASSGWPPHTAAVIGRSRLPA